MNENSFKCFWCFVLQVYSGVLDNGTQVAVKRAQEGSMQGAEEFKNEIELLSRVHHKNLLGLVGYCYEHGEQMLVYEFMMNGTVTEWLRGKLQALFILHRLLCTFRAKEQSGLIKLRIDT